MTVVEFEEKKRNPVSERAVNTKEITADFLISMLSDEIKICKELIDDKNKGLLIKSEMLDFYIKAKEKVKDEFKKAFETAIEETTSNIAELEKHKKYHEKNKQKAELTLKSLEEYKILSEGK
jgi:hypothetical protein